MDTLTRPPGTGIYSVELDANLEAARAARLYIEGVLTAWTAPADFIDTAKLLTSELAANAITHGEGRGGTITLEVRSFGCCLGVDVADHSPNIPLLRSVAIDIEHGRGLLLVAEVAESWGYYFEGNRKHVWFHLRMSDPTPPPQACRVAPAALNRPIIPNKPLPCPNPTP
jgi:anti-sigma regulatory factor (Ser/Thr protein kinase)